MDGYILEAKLEFLKRQLNTCISLPCQYWDLVGHNGQHNPIRNYCDYYEICTDGDQYNPYSSKWNIAYIPHCMQLQSPKQENELDINERLTTLIQMS